VGVEKIPVLARKSIFGMGKGAWSSKGLRPFLPVQSPLPVLSRKDLSVDRL